MIKTTILNRYFILPFFLFAFFSTGISGEESQVLRIGINRGELSSFFVDGLESSPYISQLNSWGRANNYEIDYVVDEWDHLTTSYESRDLDALIFPVLFTGESADTLLSLKAPTEKEYLPIPVYTGFHPSYLQSLEGRLSLVGSALQLPLSMDDRVPQRNSITTLKLAVLLSFMALSFYQWIHLRDKSANENILRALIASLENINHANHAETGEHTERIGLYSEILAREMKLSKTLTREIKSFASLHDVGKVAVPKEILNKSGPLTPVEVQKMQAHTTKGADIIANLRDISTKPGLAVNIVLFHHEKWNGSGYPQGLSGEDIPLEARIVSLADVYDALRMTRIYKRSFTHKEALDVILKGRGKHFDPSLVDIFLENHREFNSIFVKNSIKFRSSNPISK